MSAAFLLLLVADVALCFYNGHPVQAYEQIVLAVLAVPSHLLGAKFGRKLRRRRQLKVTHLPTIPELPLPAIREGGVSAIREGGVPAIREGGVPIIRQSGVPAIRQSESSATPEELMPAIPQRPVLRSAVPRPEDV